MTEAAPGTYTQAAYRAAQAAHRRPGDRRPTREGPAITLAEMKALAERLSVRIAAATARAERRCSRPEVRIIGRDVDALADMLAAVAALDPATCGTEARL